MICILLSFLCVIVLLGCSSNSSLNPPNSVTNENTTSSPSISKELDKQGEEDVQAENDVISTVNIQVGNNSFTAVLYDNDSTRALLEKLPLVLNMEELNGNEKFYFFPEKFPTDSERVGEVKTGDLMLFGSDCLVLFYKSFSTSYSYTRLGYIEDGTGLVDALGNGSVEVIFNLNL